ncbi:Phospholipase D1 [Actinomortierella wolfii]|nr:Phospholipase D1 [Actinomortierella wolfii]
MATPPTESPSAATNGHPADLSTLTSNTHARTKSIKSLNSVVDPATQELTEEEKQKARDVAALFTLGLQKKKTFLKGGTPSNTVTTSSFPPSSTAPTAATAASSYPADSTSSPSSSSPKNPASNKHENPVQQTLSSTSDDNDEIDDHDLNLLERLDLINPFSSKKHRSLRKSLLLQPQPFTQSSVAQSAEQQQQQQQRQWPGPGHPTTWLSEEDHLRMLQVKAIFSKLFKRKRDRGKGQTIDQDDAQAEELQIWHKVEPLLMYPSALFMGLSMMVDDKGSMLTDGAKHDWNMNIILALVKASFTHFSVTVLPYTYTSKEAKMNKRRMQLKSHILQAIDSTDTEKDKAEQKAKEKGKERALTQKEIQEKEAKEKKRFVIIKVQYGDYLPTWLVERSLDDFADLYEAYHPPIPEQSLLLKTPKVPKPPPAIRSRLFHLGKKMPTFTEKDVPNIPEEPTIEIDQSGAFDPKSAPNLAKDLQKFLQDMIRYAMVMPNAGRICKFLELSALTLANVPDGGYQGKEGYLNVVKHKRLMDEGIVANAIKKVHRKVTPKYFIVRDSFIIVAKSHNNTDIEDVILLDSSFRVEKSPRAIHSPHSFDIVNSELKLHVRASTDHRRRQFIESIRKMPSLWREPKRFDSFAPVRKNVSAQWLVDGRDYFWNASKAMEMARETIYIMDWMLSPEMLLRRFEKPDGDNSEWSLMNILERKAKEGVKIYIVLYSEVDAALHLASLRAKKLLRARCGENIWIQRHGPNLQAAWWAHHEKLIVVDSVIAFLGGLDLCFGRWDTPEHTLIDVPEREGDFEVWPGQDYSNPRIKDFCDLSRPYDDSVDRNENPRMPWHDVGLQLLGQPARDAGRHFIQRWNFLCRVKPKQRKVPFLLPKPDIHLSKLEEMGLSGTCEVQILRSVSSWSTGVKHPECSIMTAYIAAIERAEHFIYIENQFFITSTNVNRTVIHNGIGRALTDRIIRAHKEDKKFRVIVVLPLVPGFEGGINTPAATSVRMVMLNIYETICHGKNSIIGRLQSAGIVKPHKYINFYGLRNWAKLGDKFITEQVYIHAKMMVVDDRVAIIGSANINERSMLGNRDSEIAAIVRDQDYIASTMNGEPYKVSRFAHTLRMNLMMEHLGLDVSRMNDSNLPDNEARLERNLLRFSERDFVDPVHPAFFEDIWQYHAEINTNIFREMFKCIPDNTVRTWADYTRFNAHSNVEDPRMAREERTLKQKAIDMLQLPHDRIAHEDSSGEEDFDDDPGREDSADRVYRRHRTKDGHRLSTRAEVTAKNKTEEKMIEQLELQGMAHGNVGTPSGSPVSPPLRGPSLDRMAVKRTASALAKTKDVRDAMENDLSKIQGHLVEWPLDFLRDELESNNFCYPKDRNHPYDLYT